MNVYVGSSTSNATTRPEITCPVPPALLMPSMRVGHITTTTTMTTIKLPHNSSGKITYSIIHSSINFSMYMRTPGLSAIQIIYCSLTRFRRVDHEHVYAQSGCSGAIVIRTLCLSHIVRVFFATKILLLVCVVERASRFDLSVESNVRMLRRKSIFYKHTYMHG